MQYLPTITKFKKNIRNSDDCIIAQETKKNSLNLC